VLHASRRMSHRLALKTQISADDPDRKLATYKLLGIRGLRYRLKRRRLSDDVEETFYKACYAGEVELAEQLLAVLIGMLRRAESQRPDRRFDDGLIEQLNDDLNIVRQHVQSQSPAVSGSTVATPAASTRSAMAPS
jgi:hypothetical protein